MPPNKINVDQLGSTLSNENISSYTPQTKKSLTTTSLQLVRDFYQREWEKHIELNESGDNSMNCNVPTLDENSPLVVTNAKSDTRNTKIFINDKNADDISNDRLSTNVYVK